LRVPADTEGYLLRPDRPTEKLLVTIIEAEDLSVTLAVAKNIGRDISAIVKELIYGKLLWDGFRH
jgi:hypothetical protein